MKILGYNWTGLRIRRQIMLVILSEFEETESISILPEIIRKPMLINDPLFSLVEMSLLIQVVSISFTYSLNSEINVKGVSSSFHK